MKTTLILFASLITCSAISAQTTNIPDLNFETKLVNLGIDTNGINGTILNSDALAVTTLDISLASSARLDGNEVISSIEGIEAFLNLESLICSGNSLTSLPIGSNSDLTYLDFSNNQVSNLSINQNPFLTVLEAGFNQLASLNLSNNPFVEIINCESNLLSGLNVSNKDNLIELNCQNNTITVISTLPPALQTFNASNNILSQLNFENITVLEVLKVKNNNFANLDLTLATALTELDVENNALEGLDLRNGTNTSITLMNSTNNPNLELVCVDDASFSETAAGWIKDNSSMYSETCETLEIQENALLSEFNPVNPLSNFLNIPHTILNTLKSLTLYNANGQEIYNGLKSTINTSTYATGLYILKIETHSGQQKVYKLLKD